MKVPTVAVNEESCSLMDDDNDNRDNGHSTDPRRQLSCSNMVIGSERESESVKSERKERSVLLETRPSQFLFVVTKVRL